MKPDKRGHPDVIKSQTKRIIHLNVLEDISTFNFMKFHTPGGFDI